MKLTFYKYEGAGNDFIICDNRDEKFTKKNQKTIQRLCDRRFGIGADGFILLENEMDYDFKMVYYNSDGNLSSMCGNGGRCITHFARFLNIIDTTAYFLAVDGAHHAEIKDNLVRLQMNDVKELNRENDVVIVDTGSPHYVKTQYGIDKLNVDAKGAEIRYSEEFRKNGINVNFVEPMDLGFKMRTYERGVEAETLSCGTGVTAAAISMNYLGLTQSTEINVLTKGGKLRVTFEKGENGYKNIWLIGPATQVFKGEIEC